MINSQTVLGGPAFFHIKSEVDFILLKIKLNDAQIKTLKWLEFCCVSSYIWNSVYFSILL